MTQVGSPKFQRLPCLRAMLSDPGEVDTLEKHRYCLRATNNASALTNHSISIRALSLKGDIPPNGPQTPSSTLSDFVTYVTQD